MHFSYSIIVIRNLCSTQGGPGERGEKGNPGPKGDTGEIVSRTLLPQVIIPLLIHTHCYLK